ncbi:SusC/RagA family TonB-linked outer membrane protein [Butyricimonas synergistica]|uniref:SusC/RagA family TonB-linked outer membrane protein n=1 Tax=Butyricimonas synergistica TaxID=544644 RepID=UPI000379C7B0|nr:SusC/RagA family TonB-linked outer membrane protein [Butyricimonas synergistica]
MKKKSNRTRSGGRIFVRKWMMKMKIVFIFLICSLMQVHATVHAQQSKVSVELKNVPLEKVFQELERQTGYSFLYNHRDVVKRGDVSVRVENQELKTVLEDLLPRLGLAYSFDDNLVIIKVATKQEPEKKSVRLKGYVYDTQKLPLPGVTVKVVGLAVGTATNEKGWFTIELPLQKGTLEFSFVGFKKKIVAFSEITVKDTLRVYLEEDVQALDETVVVAYGKTTKRETTGSISVVKAEELEGIPSPSIANLLQGRVAGMDITNMAGSPGGGGTAIVIRGYNSLDQDLYRRFSNPLWVVDGVPMNSFTSPVTGTNMLADLNPDMIESVQVLKDASSAAIYGSRAANGVIIVTTKQGKKGQDATFSANFSQSWSILPELPTITIGREERLHRLYAYKYRNLKAYLDQETKTYRYPTSHKEVWDHIYNCTLDSYWIPRPDNQNNGGGILHDSLNVFYNNATNFFPVYYHHGKVTNANIQTYAGSERMNYSIGLGYYDETGILRGTSYSRIDLNSSMTVRPVSRLSVDMRFNASLANRRRGNSSGDIETVPGDPYELSSLNPGEGSAVWDYVLKNLRGTKEKNRSIRLRSNFRLAYDIWKGLNFSTSLSADYAINRRNTFTPSYLNSSGYSNSTGEQGINLMVLNENLLTYKQTFNEDHNVNCVAGFSYQYDQTDYNMGYAQNSPSDKIYYAPASLPALGTEGYGDYMKYIAFKHYQSDMQEKVLISYFARLEYNYQRKYLLSASFRRDGSSTFGKNNKWGTFPSVAAGWAFSEESFVKDNLGWLSYGKFRASWGRSGMDFDNCYLALGTMEVGQPTEGNSTLTPDYDQGLWNEDLSWEETDQYDFGLDLDFFNYRLGVVVDYYYRYTDKLLGRVSLPGLGTVSGYYQQWRNRAAVSNEGLELLIKYEIFRKQDLYWKLSVNGARNWNRVEKTSDGRDMVGGVIGRSLNEISVMKTDGFIDYQDDIPFYWDALGNKCYQTIEGSKSTYLRPGQFKYIDVNGDGMISSADMVKIGSPLPLFSGGLVSEFTWKNLDINISMSYQVGRYTVNQMTLNSIGNTPGPFLADINKITFWSQPGDKPDYQYGGEDSWITDRDVEKVNWLKLKTMTIGYSLPKAWSSKVGLKQIRVFASGENLLTFTNYSGLDPETIDIRTGMDGGKNYPLARKFTIGLTVKF